MKNYFAEKYNYKDPCCLNKWTWSTIFLQTMKTNSCHRVYLDDLTIDNFAQFHNTNNKIAARKKMLAGEWPGYGCEYCKNIEISGGISDRNIVNNQLEYLPTQCETQDSLYTTPKILEVYFSNKCNMKCTYCNSSLSSLWQKELEKFNLHDHNKKHILNTKNFETVKKIFWIWLQENYKKIREYRILGGEPFFQSEFQDNLDFFEKNDCRHLKVVVFTNLKISKNNLIKNLNKIKNIIENKKVDYFEIVISVDCYGPAQEYIRTGFDQDSFDNNMETIVNNYKMINLQFHSTITGLSIPTMYKLLQKRNTWQEFMGQKINWNANFVGHNVLTPHIYPKGYFDADLNKACEQLQGIEKEILIGYKNTINNNNFELEKIQNLKSYLDVLDKRRNTNWKKVFPWLEMIK